MPTEVGAMISFHVGIFVDEGLRLRIALLQLVVAINGVDQFELGVFGVLQRRLHRGDPGVLVCRVGRGRQNGELAAAGSGDVERHVGHDLADIGKVDLGDEYVFAFGRGNRRVPGHDLDALCLGRFGRRHDLIARVVRDHDRLHALGRGVGDDLDLSGDAVLRRRTEELQRRRILQFLGGLLGPLMRLVERQDPEEFRQQHHADSLSRRRHGVVSQRVSRPDCDQ